MNRLTYAASAVVIILVVAGGAILLRPTANNGAPPSPSPTHSATPSAALAPAPESLRSTWLAAAGPSASVGGQSDFLRLVINAVGTKVSVTAGGVETFTSSPVESAAAEFDLVATSTTGGCQIGDLGRYGFAFGSDGAIPASDGTKLALTLIADACPARSAVLSRTWAHALDAASNGGRGIVTAFAPMFLITLPPAGYAADAGTDSLSLTSTTPDRTLFAVKNPVGFTDPCSSTKTKLQVEPTIKAFTAYLETLPGFTVQSTALEIDGHSAAHLVIPSIQTADCPGNRVNEWIAAADAGSGGWLLNQGDTDVVYLVEVDGDLVLLQWLGQDVTTAEEEALFATVRFTDTLPQ